jgi:hypothetical protein
MLKMKCPHCDNFIVSKLLAEINEIRCEHCRETVPVHDVLVYAKGFTFHRNDLAKRLFRYKSLLHEVIQERELLEHNAEASMVSKKSLDQFLAALKEVMAGARNSLRLEFTDRMPVRFGVDNRFQVGTLTNLSTTGACLETDSATPLPQKKNPLTLLFALPGKTETCLLNGVVIWVKKHEPAGSRTSSIGVEFKDLGETLSHILWEFIAHAAKE